jgi:PAS domain-containing protein
MKLSEDKTQREAAERALRDAQEFQSRLIACSQDCIKMLDLEGRLLWMNEGGMQALEICDFRPFVNSSWIQFWVGDDAKAARDAVETASKGGTGRFTGYFATTTTMQPRWWDVVVSPIRNPQGKPERLVAVSHDCHGA